MYSIVKIKTRLPVAAASDRHRSISSLLAVCACNYQLRRYRGGANRELPPAAPRLRAAFFSYPYSILKQKRNSAKIIQYHNKFGEL